MKRITDITQLKKGDLIVRIQVDSIEELEFVCIHPHSERYSVFLDSNKDGVPKFYNTRLLCEVWYLYHGTDDDWDEIYKIMEKQCISKITDLQKFIRK